MSFDYMIKADQDARDKEQRILDTHPDTQYLLVREYWMWVDHNLFYDLVSAVTDPLQGFILAHEKHPDQGLKKIDTPTHYGHEVITLRFYPAITYLIITRAQLQHIITARDAEQAQRRKDQFDRFS